ncbi:surface lipoprotein assembly modifier [Thiomicrorhabdus sp. Milos-T2]|uniref:surface lipoprotein assembly modifier n=1 Tax=Thiomicrorhabdus sp. Milos-T2 TaxID=90814 RepID=UPI000494BB1F|nr:surface lipoprotein assembly modifier [Thiomicrorhabdus sp. Milos-T2]
MKLSKSLIAGSIALVIANSSFAVEQTDYDLFNKEFLEAVKIRDSGDVFASIEMLEKLIATQPQYKRPQLELAVAYFRASLFSDAKANAKAVLDDPKTPDSVKETIQIFLSQVEDTEAATDENRSTFEGSIGIGIGKDTNVNASPADNLVTINGIQFTLNSNSVAQEDNYGTIHAQVTHSYRIPGTVGIGSRPVQMNWNTTADISRKAYQDLGDYNLDVLTLQTGLGLISQTNWRAGINLRVDKVMLGSSDLALFKGINGNYTMIDGASEYTLTAEITDQDYLTSANESREGTRIGVGAEMKHQFKPELLGSVGVNIASSDARDDNKQYVSKAINTGLYYSVSPATLVYGELGLTVTDYNGVEPVSGTDRNDRQTTGSLGATHNFTDGILQDWTLNGKITRYNNDSDQDIYDYERTDANLEMTKRF